MDNKTKQPGSKKESTKKGANFYIALVICVVAVGAAAFTTYDSITRYAAPNERTNLQQSGHMEKTPKRSHGDDPFPKDSTKEADETKASDSPSDRGKRRQVPRQHEANCCDDSPSEDIAVAGESAGLLVFPSGKSIIKEFSGQNPVYSKTLQDWRSHNGTDFAAEQGSKVQSITGGVVREIYEDPLLGFTMTVDHDGNFTAYYSGLGNTTLVNTSDRVEPGQEIASINDIPSETCDGSHLHLAIKKDGSFINPIDILGPAN